MKRLLTGILVTAFLLTLSSHAFARETEDIARSVSFTGGHQSPEFPTAKRAVTFWEEAGAYVQTPGQKYTFSVDFYENGIFKSRVRSETNTGFNQKQRRVITNGGRCYIAYTISPVTSVTLRYGINYSTP